MARYAQGKYALAVSDISGQSFPWNEMVTQWNGLFVHYSEFESKQPQLNPYPHQADPTALGKVRVTESINLWTQYCEGCPFASLLDNAAYCARLILVKGVSV